MSLYFLWIKSGHSFNTIHDDDDTHLNLKLGLTDSWDFKFIRCPESLKGAGDGPKPCSESILVHSLIVS